MKRGCWPNPGTMGILSGFTGVALTQPVLLPPGKVAEPASTFKEKPGLLALLNSPPVVGLTQTFDRGSRAGR